jgi:hypothetical protein
MKRLIVLALVSGLTREGGTAEGAGNLLAALDRDHDGSIMDEVAEMGSSLLGSLFKQS